jgi:hypothetical protein
MQIRLWSIKLNLTTTNPEIDNQHLCMTEQVNHINRAYDHAV